MSISIVVAQEHHLCHAASICQMIEEAALVRGTGIAKRDPRYIEQKIREGKAVLAFAGDQVIGFCYIENWEGPKYVANSGLIVHPDYRKSGLARSIKQTTFQLSKQLFPEALLFGITTSEAVMKINSDLGYQPVTFSKLTQDDAFWNGCQSCRNFDILQRTQRTMCLCTAMVCDLKTVPAQPASSQQKQKAWDKFKQFLKERKLRWQKQVEKLANSPKSPLTHEKKKSSTRL